MKGKVVFRKLIWLTLLSVLILSGCSKNYDDYLKEGDKALIEGNEAIAIIAFKNAIQLEPNNSKARIQLAEAYMDIGAFTFAQKEYEKAFEIGLQCDPHYFNYQKALFRQFLYNEIVESTLDACPNFTSDPRAQLLQYLSYQALNLVNAKDRIRRNAQKQFPDAIQTKLINVYAETSDANQLAARKELLGLLSDTNQDNEVYFAQAWLSVVNGRMGDVYEAIEKYRLAEPHDLRANLLMARVSLLGNQIEDVKKEAQGVLDIYPYHAPSHAMMSEAYFRERKFQEAIVHVEQALDLGLENIQIRTIGGLSEFANNNLERSYQHLSKIKDQIENDTALTNLIEFIEIKLNIPDTESVSNSVEANTNEHNKSKLLEQFWLERLGAENLAKLENSALNEENEVGLKDVLIASYHIDRNDLTNAKVLIDKILDKNAKSIQGHNLLALYYLKTEDVDGVRTTLDKTLEINPQDPFSRLMRARDFISQNKFVEARKEIDVILAQNPSHVESINLAIVIHSNSKTIDEALELILDASEAEKGNETFQKQTIRWLITIRKIDEAIELALNLAKSPSTKDRPFFWNVVFDSYLAKNDLVAAETLVNEWQKALPSDPTAVLRKANLMYGTGKAQEAMNELNKGIQKFPSEHYLKLLKARLLIGAKQYNGANKVIDLLPSDERNSYQAKLMRSQILSNTGKGGEAKIILDELYASNPNEDVTRILFGHYLNSGKKEEGLDFLREHIANLPQSNEAKILLARHLISQAPEESKQIYVSLVESQVSSVEVFNNLAWLELQSNNLSEAEAYIEQAYELTNNNFDVLDTMIDVKLALEKKKEALNYVNQALVLIPASEELISLKAELESENEF